MERWTQQLDEIFIREQTVETETRSLMYLRIIRQGMEEVVRPTDSFSIFFAFTWLIYGVSGRQYMRPLP